MRNKCFLLHMMTPARHFFGKHPDQTTHFTLLMALNPLWVLKKGCKRSIFTTGLDRRIPDFLRLGYFYNLQRLNGFLCPIHFCINIWTWIFHRKYGTRIIKKVNICTNVRENHIRSLKSIIFQKSLLLVTLFTVQ